MICECHGKDFDAIWEIINAAAIAYKDVIPADRWKEPYMPKQELEHEIEAGVKFWGLEKGNTLAGVMGIQDVQDVTLIRHAYVRSAYQKSGIGATLLGQLKALTPKPVLVGTWADAEWAIRFYEKHGFRMVTTGEKNVLLRKYWSIPERQIETSVVLADARWRALQQPSVAAL